MKIPQQRIRDWSKLVVNLYYCYEGDVPYFGQGKVYNPSYATWLVLEGRGEITDEGSDKALVANAGDWMFVAPGNRLQKFSSDARILSVSFFANYITRKPLVDFKQSFCFSGKENPELEAQARKLPLIVDPIQNYGFFKNPNVDLFSYLTIQRDLLEWTDLWVRVLLSKGNNIESPLGLDQRVVNAIHLLESHVEDAHITTDEIARKTGVSVSQLNRLFLRDTGLTVNDFRDRQRIDLASQLLTDSEMPLKEIAYDLGFSYPSHFSTWFLRHQGVSPSKYRKNYFENE